MEQNPDALDKHGCIQPAGFALSYLWPVVQLFSKESVRNILSAVHTRILREMCSCIAVVAAKYGTAVLYLSWRTMYSHGWIHTDRSFDCCTVPYIFLSPCRCKTQICRAQGRFSSSVDEQLYTRRAGRHATGRISHLKLAIPLVLKQLHHLLHPRSNSRHGPIPMGSHDGERETRLEPPTPRRNFERKRKPSPATLLPPLPAPRSAPPVVLDPCYGSTSRRSLQSVCPAFLSRQESGRW